MSNNVTFNSTGMAGGEDDTGSGQMDTMITPLTHMIFEVTVRSAVTGVISGCGVVTNVINMIVFYRQGLFSDSSNASLMGLAVSDFINCIFIFWGSICYGMVHSVEFPNIKFNFVCYFTADRPILLWTQAICWITSYIAFERFVSVMFPFKVKFIFSAKRSYIAIAFIYFMTLLYFIPFFLTMYLDWVQQSPNGTYVLDRKPFDPVYPILHDTNITRLAFRIASVGIVLVCNIVIYLKVNVSSKFRKSASLSSSSSGNTAISGQDGKYGNKSESDEKEKSKRSSSNQKEKKLLRMITVICVLFMICYATDIILIFLTQMGFGPNWDWLTMGIFYNSNTFLVAINSSCNIIIYYTMSTRYKQELRLYFCKEPYN